MKKALYILGIVVLICAIAYTFCWFVLFIVSVVIFIAAYIINTLLLPIAISAGLILLFIGLIALTTEKLKIRRK
jgi:hypothetical protein